MRNISFILLLAVVWAAGQSVSAQSIVVQRMNPEEGEALTRYPALDQQLRFSFDFGYSHRLGKAAEEIPDDFARKMRSGVHYGIQLDYFDTQTWGMGMKLMGRTFDTKEGTLHDRLNLYYAGPVATVRLFDRKNRNALILGFSLGCLVSREKVSGGSSLLSRGNTSGQGFGTSLEMGYDIRLSKSTFLGLKLAHSAGNVKIDTYDIRENASSLDFSIGIRF